MSAGLRLRLGAAEASLREKRDLAPHLVPGFYEAEVEQTIAGLAAHCATSDDCRAVQAALLALARRGLLPNAPARRWVSLLELQKDEHIALQMEGEEGESGRGRSGRPTAAQRAAAAAAATAADAARTVVGRQQRAGAQGAAGRVHPTAAGRPAPPAIPVALLQRVMVAVYNVLDTATLVRRLAVAGGCKGRTQGLHRARPIGSRRAFIAADRPSPFVP